MAPQGELHRQGDHGEDGEEEPFGGELRALGHNLPVPGPGPGLAGERLYEVLMHLNILEGAGFVGAAAGIGEVGLGEAAEDIDV